ncbi:hypothetical protein FC99_GL001921 [Levilactobacillus koreensis JCM 16448]|uniref:RelB n=1 Tax=Levilactobacillus koreensis TaxID=637971 RepID=A0AAC8UXW1_9LACO|nr:RelB [Levilactobacillus koreensis]AKP65245.1 RelB [Levilactobacillus koreensis]KRK86171.1 hypothetical protein FC99_GL001921 [Levilactobacillus koreensis JCM 16448]
MSTDVKNKIVSTRVSSDTYARAKNNLKIQGLTIPEYTRLSLAKAANSDVDCLDFSETTIAKKEAETGQVSTIGSLAEFSDWLDSLTH